MRALRIIAIALPFALAASACSKNTPGAELPSDPTVTGTPTATDPAQQPEQTAVATFVADPAACGGARDFARIYFSYGSDRLSASAQSSLDDNLDRLASCPEVCVQLVGWADDMEPEAVALSGARANAVGVYYVSNIEAANPDRYGVVPGGVHVDSRSSEDPSTGDSRVRYVETRTVVCPREAATTP